MSTNPGRQTLQDATNTDLGGPAARQPRITPRNTDEHAANETDISKETPWRTLNQLANIPRPTTPLRRASSAGPSSTRRSARRTPGTAHRTNGSGRKAVVVTPHGRAARRELDLRRAGLTPGKDRRRSGKQQRETPRDILRQLSRHLAPKTLPTVPTAEGQSASVTRSRFRIQDEDDLDDGSEVQRPRLSLPLDEDEDEDDDSLLLPPQSAGLEDENFTVQSVELGRRAIGEQPPGKLSRGSFGSIRMSDVFADLNDTMRGDISGDAYDSSYVVGGNLGDEDMANALEDGVFGVENTVTLRDFGLDRGIFGLASGRDSDIRPANLPADDTENTFVFTVPPREALEKEVAPENLELSLLDYGQDVEELVDVENEQDGDEELDEEDNQHEESGAEELGDISNINALGHDPSILDATMQESEVAEIMKTRNARKKTVKVSKHGTQYPSLPAGVVKKLATRFARTAGSKAKINKEALDAIMQASDWFFEQVSDDLGAYAKHAGRKTIDESDIVTLMARYGQFRVLCSFGPYSNTYLHRQRQTNSATTPFSLAQKHLPRELLQELRMVPPSKLKKGRALETVEEGEED
ncbi:uncharacterized protein LY89DRAFT_601512 [Mollisia scopiformis]|uniref:CENP-T/Histone H4 histone fold domain-containing protein n=1 Tax=Mollisia scopiformis TaxID=149040 RepID=A0A132B4I9_MOLSC|nr:uncharacterized protein LY89DRAFT_601512 [Mollisia scopiformis]KUJ07320.1 hypothetical protein LY89DRAFT_601512 [Mollisia scopiformis]